MEEHPAPYSGAFMVDKSESQTLSTHRTDVACVLVFGIEVSSVAYQHRFFFAIEEGVGAVPGAWKFPALRFQLGGFACGPVRGMHARVENHSLPQH